MHNLRIAVILGGNRNGRTGPAVTRWFLDHIHAHEGVEADAVDISSLEIEDGHGAPMVDFGRRIEAADGFVVITPEYNHGYPGPLKSAIDSARREWFGKPVAFVSYGGMSGGLRAVEQLRGVFSELHTATIRDTVSFHNAHTVFGPGGEPLVDLAEADVAANTLLDRLVWWTLALREARLHNPYPG